MQNMGLSAGDISVIQSLERSKETLSNEYQNQNPELIEGEKARGNKQIIFLGRTIFALQSNQRYKERTARKNLQQAFDLLIKEIELTREAEESFAGISGLLRRRLEVYEECAKNMSKDLVILKNESLHS